MPRRELLTPVQRFQLFAFPEDKSELIRLATLLAEDFAFVRQHRGGHNRLGIAVLMIYLRFPGRVLGPTEKPHAPIIGIVLPNRESHRRRGSCTLRATRPVANICRNR
ncbi:MULTISPECIES: DUF4158 domain-containing protein [Paraburkholderia]|uniref:DUF4158 domain-containing protein n=1 Tax=Paraburkholderia TaxID=1822464 RepID=UPI0016557F33|nr:DUF4158 domain-containing protein [Paraburkholderia podalyriae]